MASTDSNRLPYMVDAFSETRSLTPWYQQLLSKMMASDTVRLRSSGIAEDYLGGNELKDGFLSQ